MPRLVRAVLIDPFACVVSDVQHDAGDYTTIYPMLSHESMPVSAFDAARPDTLKGRDVIMVDDEGLLKPCDRFFLFAGYPTPLAGKGLVLGADEEGDTVDAATSLDQIKASVVFLAAAGDRLVPTITPWQPPEKATG